MSSTFSVAVKAVKKRIGPFEKRRKRNCLAILSKLQQSVAPNIISPANEESEWEVLRD